MVVMVMLKMRSVWRRGVWNELGFTLTRNFGLAGHNGDGGGEGSDSSGGGGGGDGDDEFEKEMMMKEELMIVVDFREE